MANPEHVEIVKQGAAAVSDWYTKHPEMRLDLDGARLSGLDLSGIDLRKAFLEEASFDEVLLTGAMFQCAELAGATMASCRLTRADFSDANLAGADLSDCAADLAAIVRGYHIPDFSEWKHEDAFEKNFADLMRDLRQKAEEDEDKGGDS